MSERAGETVYIFSPWAQAVPRYHAYGRIKDIDLERSTDVTACGQVLYDGRVRYHALLRRDQADSFGQPCHRCFRSSAEDASDE